MALTLLPYARTTQEKRTRCIFSLGTYDPYAKNQSLQKQIESAYSDILSAFAYDREADAGVAINQRTNQARDFVRACCVKKISRGFLSINIITASLEQVAES